jgi:TolA protein
MKILPQPGVAPGVASNVSEARLPGFLLSLLFHLALLALVIYLPTLVPPPPPPQPGLPMILGPVTIGREGKPATSKKPRTEPSEASQQKPKPVEQRQETPEQPKPKTVERQETPEQPKPKQTATAKPAVDPNAVPLPSKDPVKKQPQANATAKAPPTKNATAKAEPTKNATPKTQPAKNATAKKAEPTKNATAKKAEPSKNATAKATPKKGDVSDALKDLEKSTKTTPGRGGGSGSGGGSSKGGATSSALAALEAGLDNDGGGGTDERGDGPGGRGGDGVGVLGSYGESVVSRVRPNWTLPGQAKNYTAIVNVKINPDGSVQRATIVRSSGSSYIDSSVVQAVMASKLEEPPAGISEMDITFNTDQLSH